MDKRIIIAIERTANLGKDLQETHPEIAELYADGMSVRQIALKLLLPQETGEGLSRCARAVSYHVTGWEGSKNVPAYLGSMTTEEVLAISEAHRTRDYVSSENRTKISLAGVIGGGKTPWLRKGDLPKGDPRPGELETALSLSNDSQYLHTRTNLCGTPNYRAIAEALHEQYPEIEQRTPQAVRVALGKAQGKY